jgi:hypothetical protein
MKRLCAVALLAAMLVVSIAINASAATLSRELLSQGQLPSWTHYSVVDSYLARCPESSFQVSASRSEARVFFVQQDTETLLAEKLVTSADSTKVYAAAIAKVADCPAATTIDGNATFQRIKALNLGRFTTPVRAFSLYAVVGGADVTGCVAYAREGSVVVEIGELSKGSINVKAFKADVAMALERVRAA